MKITKREGKSERRIVIAMIVDTAALGMIAARWEKGLFRSDWANIVGGWCVQYQKKFNRAPGKAIESLFETWAEDQPEKDTVRLVERFLDGLSGEYKALRRESQTDYVIEMAGEHFNQVRLEKLADSIQADLEAGNRGKALERVTGFGRVEMGAGAGIDVLRDKAAIFEAFTSKKEPLIVYPGALGRFFADTLERDGFVAFMGPEKRGKTWWLLDIAWRAMLQRRKVAFLEVGDMSRNQIMRRFMIRAAKRPMKATSKETGPVKIPTFIELEAGEGSSASVDREEIWFKNEMAKEEAWAACQKILDHKLKGSNDMLLRLECLPNSSISMNGVSAMLHQWERGGWTPDVVVIDYADILAPINGTAETRDQINATWAAMRRVSQELHCLLVTATQANAEAYKAHTMDQTNFSGSKTKHAHVTAMCCINQTPEEKILGVQRLNWVDNRESEFTPNTCVHVAGCLAIANPAIKSTF